MPPTSQASHGSKYEPILVSSESTINLWSVAYKEIDEETKNWIGEFDMNCEDRIQAKQLTILVRKKEDFYKSEESGVTVGEKRILWRDYASRVVAGATTIGDISVQFAPAPAAPVWSALKVLLKTHVAQLDQVTAILGCADRVLSIVRRGQVYEVIYDLRTAVDPSAVGLRDSLIKLYKGSLEFFALAAKELDGGWPKKFLQALTNPGRAELILSDLSKLEAEVLKGAGCCEREWALSVNEKHQELLQTP
nr:uncharacterized protein CTRU02_01280 [Colletotrichum truncatum]KAF6800875.1 hypothetical protein CTRU02_01280 [Colletotrichum truncatum]